MKTKGASSVSVCTLLDKPARRKVHFEVVGEGKYYCGFEVIFFNTSSTDTISMSKMVSALFSDKSNTTA